MRKGRGDQDRPHPHCIAHPQLPSNLPPPLPDRRTKARGHEVLSCVRHRDATAFVEASDALRANDLPGAVARSVWDGVQTQGRGGLPSSSIVWHGVGVQGEGGGDPPLFSCIGMGKGGRGQRERVTPIPSFSKSMSRIPSLFPPPTPLSSQTNLAVGHPTADSPPPRDYQRDLGSNYLEAFESQLEEEERLNITCAKIRGFKLRYSTVWV